MVLIAVELSVLNLTSKTATNSPFQPNEVDKHAEAIPTSRQREQWFFPTSVPGAAAGVSLPDDRRNLAPAPEEAPVSETLHGHARETQAARHRPAQQTGHVPR